MVLFLRLVVFFNFLRSACRLRLNARSDTSHGKLVPETREQKTLSLRPRRDQSRPRSQEMRAAEAEIPDATHDFFQGRSPILRRLAAAASACRSSALHRPLCSAERPLHLRSLLCALGAEAGKGWLQLQPSLGGGKSRKMTNDQPSCQGIH